MTGLDDTTSENWTTAMSSPASSSSAAAHSQASGCLAPSPPLASRAVTDFAPPAVARAPSRWVAVPGWVGLYEVSRFGQVRSVPRVVRRSDGRLVPYLGQVLTPSTDGRGYLIVRLHDAGRRRTVKVHKLVALAFLGPPPSGLEVRHLDGDRRNARLTNLIYGTRSENAYDRVRHARERKRRRTA